MLARDALLLTLTTLAFAVAGCEDDDGCTAVGIVRDMVYTANLPANADIATTTIEVCFGESCETSRLNQTVDGESSQPVVFCEDIDGRTPKFSTRCSFAPGEREVTFSTNTVYGGHAGSDRLVITAIDAAGARSEMLRGRVDYTDTTDDGARGACTVAWEGKLTKE